MRVYFVPTALVTLLFAVGSAAALDFDKLDRRIVKEPAYQSKPLYGLAMLGSDAKTHVWMVLDGERLYVDKNCNGDLTDDGPPAELKNKGTDPASFEDIEVTPDGGVTVYKFEVTLWGRPSLRPEAGPDREPFNQSVHVTFPDGRWFGAWGDHHAPLMFSSSAGKAPAMYFGGALRMGFEVRKPIERVAGGFQLSACVGTPGSCPGAWVHLLYKTIPKDVHPKVELEFPPEVAGGQPVRAQLVLGQRC
jgi:hypothetical protein